MSDLDKQIEEEAVTIFKLGMMDALGGKSKPTPIPALKEAIGNIKQAFKDAGWVCLRNVDTMTEKEWEAKQPDIQYQRGVSDSFYFKGDMNALKEANGFMTGQEWYDRFDKELDNFVEENYLDAIYPHDALKAAKKAAGIE